MISVFHTEVSNPELPAELAGGTESGVVLGSDYARTHHLAFILGTCTPNKRGWEGFALAELAIHGKENVIGSADYEALLSLCLKAATSDILSMGASRAVLPKADVLLKRRRSMPVSALDPADPATAVVRSAESFLQKAGYHVIDDDIRALAQLPPGHLPIRTSTTVTSTHLVLLISSGITSVESALFGKYLLNPDPMWIRKITVVVEDMVAWNIIKSVVKSQVQVVEEFLEPGEAPKEPISYGHLAWDKCSLLGHMGGLRNLARLALRKGAKLADICAVTRTKADACAVRTRLIELGVPVQCSESHLLFMRPGVLTLMAFLSLAHGYGNLPGLVRLAGISKDVAAGELEELYRILEARGQEVNVFSNQINAVFESLPSVRARLIGEPSAVLHDAMQSMSSWATPEHQQDASTYWTALLAWSTQFNSVRPMLIAYWKMRALLADWTGYLPNSGIHVSEIIPGTAPKWLVLVGTEPMSIPALPPGHESTVITAPVE